MSSPATRNPALGKAIRTPAKKENQTPSSVPRVAKVSPKTEGRPQSQTQHHGNAYIPPHGVAKSAGRCRRLNPVEKAQEEVLRAFGGKSLGNVLQDFGGKSNVSNDDGGAKSGERVVSRLERAREEAEKCFGGQTLDDLTVDVKHVREENEKRRNQVTPANGVKVVKKLDLVKQEASKIWESEELGALNIKPALTRVEKELLEMKRYQPSQEELDEEVRLAEAVRRARLEEEAREAEERKRRDAERQARFEEAKRKEAERLERMKREREARKVAKVAPFMQTAKPTAEIISTPAPAAAVVAPKKELAPTIVVAAPTPSPAPVAPAKEEVAIVEPTTEEPSSPQRFSYVTAPGSPAVGADVSVSELLDAISIGDLSILVSPSNVTTTQRARDEDDDDEDDDEPIEEIASTLPKHRTPLHRLPFHEKPTVPPEMKDALQEIAEADATRAEAAMESMRQSLSGRTVKDLKEELKERGLKVTGKKTELVDRLVEWHREDEMRKNGGSCAVM